MHGHMNVKKAHQSKQYTDNYKKYIIIIYTFIWVSYKKANNVQLHKMYEMYY